MQRALAAAILLAATPVLADDGAKPGIAHGGPIVHDDSGGDCITPFERQAGFAAIADYVNSHAYSGRTRPLIPFVPMGGTLFSDILPPGYVDHDNSTGFQDYSCH